jgi:hypothetical protein
LAIRQLPVGVDVDVGQLPDEAVHRFEVAVDAIERGFHEEIAGDLLLDERRGDVVVGQPERRIAEVAGEGRIDRSSLTSERKLAPLTAKPLANDVGTDCP